MTGGQRFSIRIFVIVLSCASMLVGCSLWKPQVSVVKEPARTTQARIGYTGISHTGISHTGIRWPVELDSFIKPGKLRSEYGDILGSPVVGDKKIAPIPGRLLVKINPSELASRFKLDTPAYIDLRKALQQYGLIPSSVRLKAARYVGQTRSKNIAFHLELENRVNVNQVKQLLRQNNVSYIGAVHGNERSKFAKQIMVELSKEQLDRYPELIGRPSFNRIKSTSPLRGVLKDNGVQSIRRLFRATEKKSRATNEYRVVPMRELLDRAAERYPVRTARGEPSKKSDRQMENWFVVTLKPGISVKNVIAKLRDFEDIEKVSADFPVSTAEYPAQFDNQWGLKNTGQTGGTAGEDINIEPAWLDTAPSSGPITVAVIDEGFKEDLDQFANRLWVNTGETGAGTTIGMDDDCNGYVDDIHGMTAYDPWAIIYNGDPCTVSPGGPSVPFSTHGTMVAGIIAADHAVTAAMNPNAIAGTAGTTDVDLMNLVVGNCDVSSPLASGVAEIAESLIYAIDKGADIANISLSSLAAPIVLQEAVDDALEAGLIIAASAGNGGTRYTTQYGGYNFCAYPACLPGVINVGGMNHLGQNWPDSNYGPGLDLVAPAENVRTITYSADNQTAAEFIDIGGTSASAAFVTGTAAIALSKYPAITGNYMRQMLRATARDVLDPLGQGDNLVGEDEWTGKGVLDAGTIVQALADPTDAPINVDILVERNKSIPYYLRDAVGGSPDLGITVTTPDYCTLGGTNICLDSWQLEYGEGDSPTSWTPIPIADTSVTSNVIDVPRTGGPLIHNIDVASGHNYLYTDVLTNNQLYTIRLVAQNNATPPRVFEDKDYFIPLRAKLTYPPDGISLVGHRGLGHHYGVADKRDGAYYRVAYYDETASSELWSGNFSYPSQRSTDPGWTSSEFAYMELMGKYDHNGTVPLNPDIDLTTQPEGWVQASLEVYNPAAVNEYDANRLYLDNSHFPFAPNWPRDVLPRERAYAHHLDSVYATDMGGSVGTRIFLYSNENLLCFDPDGTLLWETAGGRHNAYYAMYELPGFAVVDVDGDGVKEIAYHALNRESYDGFYIHLLNHDGTELAGWPKSFTYQTGGLGGTHIRGVDKLYAADVTGSADKEIIIYKHPYYYYGINEADIAPGWLYVYGADGQFIWRKEFPPETKILRLEVGDIDNDGKDEILLEPDRILEGDGTFKPGWEDQQNPGYLSRLVNLDVSTPEHEVVMFPEYWSQSYEIRVVDAAGNDLSGWPQQLMSTVSYDGYRPYPRQPVIKFGQVVAGSNPEMIICDDAIRVLGSDGQPVASSATIDIDGVCQGIKPVDTNNDDVIDTYYVLVSRWQRNAPPDYRKGEFLEAYRVDGTRLADGDNRWPVVLDTLMVQRTDILNYSYWNGVVAVEDIDGDNLMEAIVLFRTKKYDSQTAQPDTRIEVYELP